MPTSSLFKMWEEIFSFSSFLLFGRGSGDQCYNKSIERMNQCLFLRLLISFLCRAGLSFGSCGTFTSLRAHISTSWIMVELYITNNNNNTNKTTCKQSPVVIVVTLQVCAKVYVCIWMYVLEDFLETFFVFYLFIDSLGATGVHCELYSEGLDIPFFIDFRNAEH